MGRNGITPGFCQFSRIFSVVTHKRGLGVNRIPAHFFAISYPPAWRGLCIFDHEVANI